MGSVIGLHGGIKVMTMPEAQAHLREVDAAYNAADARYVAALAECQEAQKSVEACGRELEGARKALLMAALAPEK